VKESAAVAAYLARHDPWVSRLLQPDVGTESLGLTVTVGSYGRGGPLGTGVLVYVSSNGGYSTELVPADFGVCRAAVAAAAAVGLPTGVRGSRLVVIVYQNGGDVVEAAGGSCAAV
jgi:hypothetical protein